MMTQDEIKAEAEYFLEWDTDKRDYITYYSAICFVEHCLKKQLENYEKIKFCRD